jgi:serine/threonine protein kinase
MLQPGQRLGDFEILRFLGKGGMGVVYEAQQTSPARHVAVKVLAPWLADDEAALQRFWREAEVPARLDHPGIVRIIATGKTAEGLAYYAMQLVRGLSLAQLMRLSAELPVAGTVPATNPARVDGPAPHGVSTMTPPSTDPTPVAGSIPPIAQEYLEHRYQTVARLGSQAARALAAAHTLGYLHRDVKPSNLMVDVHGQLYVMDFGLTRALTPDGQSTQAGLIRGTPWYMSPEQAAAGDIDHRSDIYSLGVTLYELATQGLGPFTANRRNIAAVLAQVRAGDCLPLRLLAPDVPPRLERIIARAMDRSPRHRYQQADDLARELDAVAEESATQIPVPRRPLSIRWLWITRPSAGQWAAIGAVVVLLLLLAAWLGALLFPRPGAASANSDPNTALPAKDGSWVSLVPRPRERHPIALLLDDGNPFWYRKLAGTGDFLAMEEPNQLLLQAPSDDSYTVVALADDPRASAFEFSVELFSMRSPKALITDDQMGIFFGWHHEANDPETSPRFFVLHLDDRPSAGRPNGQVTLGTGQIVEAVGDRVGFTNILPMNPIGGADGVIPLANSGTWHRLRVRCDGPHIQVRADSLEARSFDLEQARNQELPGARLLETRGAVGIWAHRGNALFRQMQFTILKLER